MFTGLIEHLGELKEIIRRDNGHRLTIAHTVGEIPSGASVAINGVCLTATSTDKQHFIVDVSPETLQVTNFSALKPGDLVNMERPLTLDKPLGGHFVTGHVDGVVTVKALAVHDDFTEFVFSGVQHPEWVVEKGSICLDGVSLTINRVTQSEISCMIIPHTMMHTHFNSLSIGSKLNVEYDYLAKIVAKQMLRNPVC